MQLLPMASSPDGLISAWYAVITKTPGWEVLTTTSSRGMGVGVRGKDGRPDQDPRPECKGVDRHVRERNALHPNPATIPSHT